MLPLPAEVRVLTPQRQLFCCAYLASNFNAREAGLKAGYARDSVDTQTSRILADPKVRLALNKLIEQRARKFAIRADDVLRELALLGFSNMLDYMTVDEHGLGQIDLSGLTRDRAAAIQEVTSEVTKTIYDGDGNEVGHVTKTKLKLHDKRAPLVDLGKHLGLFREDRPAGMQIGEVKIQVLYEQRRPYEALDTGETNNLGVGATLPGSAAHADGGRGPTAGQ